MTDPETSVYELDYKQLAHRIVQQLLDVYKRQSPKTAQSIHQIIVSAMKPTNAYHSSSEYGKTTQKFFQIPSNSLKAQETRLISLEISRERSGMQYQAVACVHFEKAEKKGQCPLLKVRQR